MKRATILALVLASTAPFALSADKPSTKQAASEPKAPAPAPAEAPKAAAPLTDPVAVVDGVEIKKDELEKAFAAIVSAQGMPVESVPEAERMQGYKMILDDLVIDRILDKKAASVQIPEEEVNATFERVRANFGSEEELQAQIKKTGRSVEGVKEDIRSSLRQQRWVNDQIKTTTEVTDADAEKFYKENPDQFKQPEQVRASHILVAVEPEAKPEVVTEREKKAQEIAGRVKKGEAFDKLAKELSEDPSAKENAGDLEFFTKEQMVPEFSNAAFAMKKDEISEPVRSQFGYHIIKVTDRKAPETVSLDQAKPQLLAYLRQRKKQEEMEKLVKGLREAADVKINLPQ